MKIFAIHLPAFHQIKENDEWWGEGFTEWDNVRSGKKYYKNHIQPKVPHEGKYYDLSKKEDIETQIDTANKYGVDGFVFYHYWFGNDNLIFERPVEILKNEIDKKIEYCFCWANESWITTWHGKDPEQLMPQVYEGKKDWKKHIDYFISFFKDDRYIKIDGRPVLFIYKPNEIPQYEEMIEFWNNCLNKEGIDNIYLIEYISSKNRSLHSEKSDGVVEFEPLYTTFFDISIFNKFKRYLCKKLHIIDFQNYDNLWKKIIKRKRLYSNKTIYKGCFVAWDNSPRKEKNSMIVKGASPQKFGKYLKQLIKKKRKNCSNDFVLINAWNEWSEGAMLEATQHEGFEYLQTIKQIKEEMNKKK